MIDFLQNLPELWQGILLTFAGFGVLIVVTIYGVTKFVGTKLAPISQQVTPTKENGERFADRVLSRLTEIERRVSAVEVGHQNLLKQLHFGEKELASLNGFLRGAGWKPPVRPGDES